MPLTGDAILGSSSALSEFCAENGTDMRKSFPSGHASTSAVLMVYNVRPWLGCQFPSASMSP